MIPKAPTLTEAAAELVRVLVQSGATPDAEKLEQLVADSAKKRSVGPEAFMLHYRTDGTASGAPSAWRPEPVYCEPDFNWAKRRASFS